MTPKSVDVHRRAWLSSHLEANAPHARWHHGLRGSRTKAEHLEVVRQLNVHLKSGITMGQPGVKKMGESWIIMADSDGYITLYNHDGEMAS